MRLVSLLFICDGDRVLLAKKKTKFGIGYWNGFGGGVEAGESVEQSACRETKEECGLEVLPEDVKQVAHIIFRFKDVPTYDHDVYIFTTEKFRGVPTETREMSVPEWHELSKLPLSEMWPSDTHWVPLVLSQGKTIEATRIFAGTEQPFVVEKFEYKEVGF